MTLSASLLLALPLIGCGGMDLKPSEPSPSIKDPPPTPSDLQIFSTDDSLWDTPEFWLGDIGVMRQQNGECGTEPTGSKFEWVDTLHYRPAAPAASGAPAAPVASAAPAASGAPAAPVANAAPAASVAPAATAATTGVVEGFLADLGYPVAPKSVSPILRVESVVTRQIAANAAVLSFFSGDLSDDVVAEVVLSDIARQRIPPTSQFQSAVDAYTASTRFPTGKDVCYVFVVMGYTQKTLLRKYNSKITAKAGGGYSGVNVGGSYYASDKDYKFDPIFGLSIRVLHRPGQTPTGGDAANPKDAADLQQALNASRKPSDQKSFALGAVTHPSQPKDKLELLRRFRAATKGAP
jgi:hypothetical protein